MSTYNYQHLQSSSETRLLQLEPAARYHDTLIGSIIHTSLYSDTHTYEALSYVWDSSSNAWTSTYNWSPPGIKFAFYPLSRNDFEEIPESSYDDSEQLVANKSPGEIICDGQAVTIGAELFDALRRLRLRDRQRTIWIDAICINQNDIIERNVQVQNMREIYSKADNVLIWVGEHFSSGPASQNLLDFILELEDLITNIMNEHGPNDLQAIERSLIDGYIVYSTRWNFLMALLSQAWFVSFAHSLDSQASRLFYMEKSPKASKFTSSSRSNRIIGSSMGTPRSSQRKESDFVCWVRQMRLGHYCCYHQMAFHVRCQRPYQHPPNDLCFACHRYDMEPLSTERRSSQATSSTPARCLGRFTTIPKHLPSG